MLSYSEECDSLSIPSGRNNEMCIKMLRRKYSEPRQSASNFMYVFLFLRLNNKMPYFNFHYITFLCEVLMMSVLRRLMETLIIMPKTKFRSNTKTYLIMYSISVPSFLT